MREKGGRLGGKLGVIETQRDLRKDLSTVFNAAKASHKTETVKAEHVLFFCMETQIHVFHCYLYLLTVVE